MCLSSNETLKPTKKQQYQKYFTYRKREYCVGVVVFLLDDDSGVGVRVVSSCFFFQWKNKYWVFNIFKFIISVIIVNRIDIFLP